MTSQVTDILVRARKLIENKDDWGQGVERHMSGRRCSLDALLDAGRGRESGAVLALKRAARLSSNDFIADWNDTPERTHAEVLAAFDRAIEASKQQ